MNTLPGDFDFLKGNSQPVFWGYGVQFAQRGREDVLVVARRLMPSQAP